VCTRLGINVLVARWFLTRRIKEGQRSKSLRKLGSECQQTREELQRAHDLLNRALAEYTVHLGVGYTSIWDARRAGLVPVSKEKSFEVRYGDSTLCDSDAAMALVRLYLAGELGRIGRCERC
jgi:hypothetical protein